MRTALIREDQPGSVVPLGSAGRPRPPHGITANAEHSLQAINGPRRATVLVVDDDAAVRSVVRRCLERRDLEVLEAGSAPAALELSGRHCGPIHLLITDIVMPGMNGCQLAGRLVGERSGLKVLYISGYAEPAPDRLEGGDFLAKPFAMETLLAKVDQLLGMRGRSAAG